LTLSRLGLAAGITVLLLLFLLSLLRRFKAPARAVTSEVASSSWTSSMSSPEKSKLKDMASLSFLPSFLLSFLRVLLCCDFLPTVGLFVFVNQSPVTLVCFLVSFYVLVSFLFCLSRSLSDEKEPFCS